MSAVAEYAVGRPALGGVDWDAMTEIIEPLAGPVSVTQRQLDLLRFIDSTQRKTGRTPTYREMSQAIYGVPNTGGVPHQIQQLVRKGLIEHKRDRVRGITLRVQMLRLP